jgi:hypothetical protein
MAKLFRVLFSGGLIVSRSTVFGAASDRNE